VSAKLPKLKNSEWDALIDILNDDEIANSIKKEYVKREYGITPAQLKKIKQKLILK